MATNEILSKVKITLKEKKGPHDLSHILRVREIALKISETENADKKVVEAMALLHDLIRHEDEREKISVDETLKEAKKILVESNWPEEKISAVLDGIASHSLHSKLYKEPETLEAKILFDADKIDSVGEIGVARWFMTMAHKKVSVQEAAKIYLNTIEKMEGKLGGKLYTKKGDELIQDGLEFSKKFMKQLI